jgi:hypothetical protein
MVEQSTKKRHSDTVNFLRGKLDQSINKESLVTLWLVVGISLTGLFFASIILYLLWAHHR